MAIASNSSDVFNTLSTYLNDNNISFQSIQHEPTYTSEQSAQARGEDLSMGGKALVMKIDDKFHLFVISASKKCDSKKIKEHMKAKKIRFATSDELMNLTGLVPGSIPPFGQPILPFELHVDESILKNEKIAFNAGDLTRSIIMLVKDYLNITKADIFLFSSD
jgi:prolyl-tRNA editing enzyme YbaK/EbsC (Cys-tRNA(Pro) deacylase)